MVAVVTLRGMDFTKITKVARFRDPFQNFAEVERVSEIRTDPLSGHTARILDFPVRSLGRVDLSPIIEKSKTTCPFCPEIIDKMTPKFSPSVVSRERYARGEALCVPNVFPHDENFALTVMTKKHYVGLTEFTHEVLKDSLLCCMDYLMELLIKQPGAVYQSINWNYLPLAGGSIVHPHLQIIASSTPTRYYTEVISSVERYKRENKNSLWKDFITAEEHQKERFIAYSDGVLWTVAFAPMGIFDVMAIIERTRKPADINGVVLDSLVSGILSTLRFIDSLNMYSFNMSLYFFTNNSLFLPHLRICPRISLPPLGACEINYMRMLHNETLTTLKPEDLCERIKPFWDS